MSLPWSGKGFKVTPVIADEIMLIDSADSDPTTTNKRATLGSLPFAANAAWDAIIVKPSDTSRNSTIVPVADPALTTTLPVGTSRFMFDLFWQAQTGVGLRTELSFSGGVVGPIAWGSIGSDVKGLNVAAQLLFTNSGFDSNVQIVGKVEILSSPTTITLDWAQVNSDAINTTVLAGSELFQKLVI